MVPLAGEDWQSPGLTPGLAEQGLPEAPAVGSDPCRWPIRSTVLRELISFGSSDHSIA